MFAECGGYAGRGGTAALADAGGLLAPPAVELASAYPHGGTFEFVTVRGPRHFALCVPDALHRDPDPAFAPVGPRPGWQEIERLAEAGDIAGVVTVTRSTVALTARDWNRARDRLAEHGVRLTTVRAHDLPGPIPGM